MNPEGNVVSFCKAEKSSSKDDPTLNESFIMEGNKEIPFAVDDQSFCSDHNTFGHFDMDSASNILLHDPIDSEDFMLSQTSIDTIDMCINILSILFSLILLYNCSVNVINNFENASNHNSTNWCIVSYWIYIGCKLLR